MKSNTALVGAAALAMASSAVVAQNLTIRQIAGQTKMQENSAKVADIFALDREGKTKEAAAIYATLSEGLRRGVDNGRAARDGKLDPKSQAQVDNTRALYAAVKSGDVAGVTTAFGAFSEKARPGVLKTLGSMVAAGRVTPAMAEAIGGFKA